MFALALAELRGAWTSWLAVLIAFVATSFSIVLALVVIDSAIANVNAGVVPDYEATAVIFAPSWNLLLALIGTLSVIGAVTGLVVQARRGALARLALAGASPGQVSRILLIQLLLVSLAGAVLGVVLALVLQPAAVRMMLGDRGIDTAGVIVNYKVSLIVLGAAAFIVFALLAGLRQSRVAAAVPPVEALRTVPGAATSRGWILRAIGAVLLFLTIVVITVAVTLAGPSMGVDGADTVLQAAVICMLLTTLALSMSAPLTVGALTRAWTALVPVRSASWVLARAAVVHKRERLARTVTPIALTVGLLVGMGTIMASIQKLLHQMGHPGLENASMLSLLILIALILIISVSGGISVVLMMSKQRESELALAGVVGATIRQRALVTVCEGVIITVTATILGIVMTTVGMIVFVIGLSGLGLTAPLVVPWRDFTTVFTVCLLVVVAATTLPVLPSLRRPPHRLVSRLVAE